MKRWRGYYRRVGFCRRGFQFVSISSISFSPCLDSTSLFRILSTFFVARTVCSHALIITSSTGITYPESLLGTLSISLYSNNHSCTLAK